MKLTACLSEKPWGQVDVPPYHGGFDGVRIGEVAFRHPAGTTLPVLIKYLYTSERLSIQVHPDDAQARAAGYPCGKDEMWIVLEAEPDATIGLGLKQECDPREFAAAVRDGSVVELLDWKPVSPGDVIYNKAGTIHAAGAGLVLLEVQQSLDLTYRLFDYGRPRELHLEEGLRVSHFGRHDDARDGSLADGRSQILANGPYFGSAWCAGSLPSGLPTMADWQVVVVNGAVRHQGVAYEAGQAFFATTLAGLDLPADTDLLVAWPVQAAMAQAA